MTGYSILWRLVPYAAAVLIGILAYLHLQSLKRERDAALAAQVVTMQALGTESAAKRALTAALVASNRALAEREAAQRVLDRRLAERRGNLENSIRAPEAQPWAAARMPPDVYRGLRAARANRHDQSPSGDAPAVTPRRD